MEAKHFTSRTNINTDALKDKLGPVQKWLEKRDGRIGSPWPSTTGPQEMAVNTLDLANQTCRVGFFCVPRR